MKDKYLVDFQNYFKALSFKFIIEYYSDNTLKLVAENEGGQAETIYEDISDNTSAHIIDNKIKDFLLDFIQEKLLQYGDLNITRYYEPWSGFIIDGVAFSIETYKGDYNLFLKSILNFAERCAQDTK